MQLDDSKYRFQTGERVCCLLLGTTTPKDILFGLDEKLCSALHTLLLLKVHGAQDYLYRRLGVLTMCKWYQGIDELCNRFDGVSPTTIKLA